LSVKAPQDFFLKPRAPPSVRPGLRPWSGLSFPRTRSVSASPPLAGPDVPGPGRRPLRSRKTPSASGTRRWVVSCVPHTDLRLQPCPKDAASEWPLSLLRCSACALFSYVLSVILTEERFLHFQLRRDSLDLRCIHNEYSEASLVGCVEISAVIGQRHAPGKGSLKVVRRTVQHVHSAGWMRFTV